MRYNRTVYYRPANTYDDYTGEIQHEDAFKRITMVGVTSQTNSGDEAFNQHDQVILTRLRDFPKDFFKSIITIDGFDWVFIDGGYNKVVDGSYMHNNVTAHFIKQGVSKYSHADFDNMIEANGWWWFDTDESATGSSDMIAPDDAPGVDKIGVKRG